MAIVIPNLDSEKLHYTTDCTLNYKFQSMTLVQGHLKLSACIKFKQYNFTHQPILYCVTNFIFC